MSTGKLGRRAESVDSVDEDAMRSKGSGGPTTHTTEDQNSALGVSFSHLPPPVSNYEMEARGKRLVFYVFIVILCLSTLVLAIVLPLTVRSWAARLHRTGNGPDWALPSVQARTSCGLVEGRLNNDAVVEFLGIPYALPPTGRRRLRPPAEILFPDICKEVVPNPLRVTEAKVYKPSCLQTPPVASNSAGLSLIGSEDCLYLNVFTPEVRPASDNIKKRPVVVFLNSLLFHRVPAWTVLPEVVQAVDAVHVTLNYRLGPLGFLIDPDTNATNFGLQDQRLALRWIRSNIASFGGDPDNVALVGTGSGATAAFLLLAAMRPGEEKLFHKLWISSPALQPTTSLERAYERQRRDYPQCTNLSCFQNLDPEVLFSQWKFRSNSMMDQMFDFPSLEEETAKDGGFLIVDNDLVRENFWKYLPEASKRVPLVLGTNSHEANLLVAPKTVRFWQAGEFRAYIRSKLGAKFSDNATRRLLGLYDNTLTSSSPAANDSRPLVEEVYTELVTDIRVTCPIDNVVDLISRDESRLIYRFALRHQHSPIDPYGLVFSVRTAVHGWDAFLYLRGYQTHPDYAADYYDNRDEVALSEALNSLVREFVWHNDIPRFRRRQAAKQYTNLVGPQGISSVENYKVEQCRFWRDLGGDDVARFSWMY